MKGYCNLVHINVSSEPFCHKLRREGKREVQVRTHETGQKKTGTKSELQLLS